MIKVRYRDPNDLSPGLHATAERRGRGTIVYLLSGLSSAQRRSALRRLRLSARMGHAPRLSAWQLALALFADRIRTGLGRAGAVFRLHPAGSTLPIMVLSGAAIAFLLFSTVSIRVLPHSRLQAQTPLAGAGTTSPAREVPVSGPSPDPEAAGLGEPGQAGSDSGTQARAGSGGTRPGSAAGAAGQDGSGGGTGGGTGGTTTGSGTTSGSSGSGTTSGSSGSGTTSGSSGDPASTTGAVAPAPAAQSSTATAPATSASSSSATPTPTPTTSSGICLDVGPLGICLDL